MSKGGRILPPPPGSFRVKHDLFNFFCSELATTVLLFVATKDKFEFLHLPDLINDVQFPSLICLSLQLESKKYFNLQHYMIITTPPGGLIKS